MASRVFFEPIRTLGFAGISGAYASIGDPTNYNVRIFCITNNTAGDMYFTTDTSQDQMFIAAGSFKLYDLQANKGPNDDRFVLPIGSQFSVKQITSPVSGDVYVELIY